MIITYTLNRKTFAFELPDETRMRLIVPCFYPNTDRIEIRMGKHTIHPTYTIDEHGTLDIFQKPPELSTST